MSKEYRLQFNDKFISIEEQYQKDNGAILFGETNNDGRLYILYDSHDNKKIEFFIELIKYVADLKTKLTENIVLLEGLRKSEEEKKDIAMKRVYELKQQLAEKEQELNDLCQNYDFQLNDFSREVYRLQQREKLLKQQLAEKDKEIDKLEDKLHHYYEETLNNGTCGLCEHLRGEYKTDFAIEQLERALDIVENGLDDALKNSSLNSSYYDKILDKLDQQIKDLKEKK